MPCHNNPFACCSNLEKITVDKNNDSYYSDGNCIIRTSDKVLSVGCKNSIIPDGVASIGDYAFYGYTSLTDITIPNSVTIIGTGAFSNCTGLASVTMGNSVTNIGNNAFYGCVNLTSITIPNGMTHIGSNAFLDCRKLVEVINLSQLNITKGSREYGSVGYYATEIRTGESKA